MYYFDILLLQETNLKDAEEFICPAYICCQIPVGQMIVIVVTYVNKKEFKHTSVDRSDISNVTIEIIVDDVMFNNQEWRIVNA